jgi:cell division protein FtsB
MPRRVRKTKPRLPSLAESFVKKLSTADARLRRKVIRYAFWGMGILFFYSLMVGTYGIPRIIRLEVQKSALVESNQQLLVNLIDSDRVRRMLESDPIYLERIARTRFHMARPDETIYLYRGR